MCRRGRGVVADGVADGDGHPAGAARAGGAPGGGLDRGGADAVGVSAPAAAGVGAGLGAGLKVAGEPFDSRGPLTAPATLAPPAALDVGRVPVRSPGVEAPGRRAVRHDGLLLPAAPVTGAALAAYVRAHPLPRPPGAVQPVFQPLRHGTRPQFALLAYGPERHAALVRWPTGTLRWEDTASLRARGFTLPETAALDLDLSVDLALAGDVAPP
jgi:hypothetical protein